MSFAIAIKARRPCTPSPCFCGSENVGVEYARVAEDSVETWVECADCGAVGERTEDAFADDCAAVDLWNQVH
jgi:hypothetical protein